MKRDRFPIVLALAVVLGLLIAWADNRPGWDDTGLTAGAVFVAAAVCGLARPRRAWLWALAVGAWIPLIGIVAHGNVGSLLALGVAFAGAYAGALIRRLASGLWPSFGGKSL